MNRTREGKKKKKREEEEKKNKKEKKGETRGGKSAQVGEEGVGALSPKKKKI